MSRKNRFYKMAAVIGMAAWMMNPGVLAAHADGASWIQAGSSWWYRHADGGYTANGWELINGNWYHFDAEGWMQTGWLDINGTWYYLQPDGAMLHDQWIGEWYVDSSGAWDPGAGKAQWLQSGERWWYRHADGGYTTNGWELINGSWYHFDGNGWMQTGWLEIDGTWYYLTTDGAMKTDWLRMGNSWYYLKPDGAMETEWGAVKGELYYFDESGHMQTGWQLVDDIWHYFEDSGRMNDSARPSGERPEAPENIKQEAFQRTHQDIEIIQENLNMALRDDLSGTTYAYENENREYDKLTDSQKAVYDQMLSDIMEYRPIKYTAIDDGYEKMDMAVAASCAILQDYPVTNNYVGMQDILDGNMTTAVEIVYFMPNAMRIEPAEDIESLKHEMAVFDEECNQIVAGMPEGLSAYDQYRYLAGIISVRTRYDYSQDKPWSVVDSYGAIQGGLSICAGYAEGYDYLCRKADLYCRIVSGSDRNDMGHEWNLVKLEDGTYHVDVTWCDGPAYPFEWEWHKYFMCTQDYISMDHIIEDHTAATGTVEYYQP